MRSHARPDTPLLYVLRNEFGLNGPQFGCGLGQCGACTVLIDGEATRSCTVPISRVGSGVVTTLEGIGSIDHLHPLQQAFVDEQAAQCGVCSNGMIMTALAFLSHNPDPDEDSIRHALDANLCRCGSHARVIRAVRRAAVQMRKADADDQGAAHG